MNKTPADITGTNLLPDGITLADLKAYWDVASVEYSEIRKRMYLLDGADRGQLWKTIVAQFPTYQVLPETNHINYIKENLLASIYSVSKAAMLLPRSSTDTEVCNQLNAFFDKMWAQLGISKYQRKAGDRAALVNLGITQVGWRNSIIGGTTNSLYKGDVVLKNINPQKFMRDPYADVEENSSYMMTWEDYHITKLKTTPIYKTRIKELINTLGSNFVSDNSTLSYATASDRNKYDKTTKDYHLVVSYWVKMADEEGKESIYEIHVLNHNYVLYVNKMFFTGYPFAFLYCNEPGDDIVGVSEPAKAFSNYLAYNLLNSIIATHAYKAQRPPRFLNIQSGINIRQFAKHGADADKTWLCNGDASMAVHYGKFPDLPPILEILISKLDYDIKDKSGIDDMYAGKDFGSITTTGGSDNLISRTTGRDTIKIQLYEEYTKMLTLLIAKFYIKYGGERKIAIKDKTSNNIKELLINFTNISNTTTPDAELTIQSDLPKSKMRLAQMANVLLEKQVQYNPTPKIITNEEWLMMQDIPFKSLILDRIRLEQTAETSEDVTKVLFQFAGLIEQGVDPTEALNMVIDTTQSEKQPTDDLKTLGNTAGAGSFQAKQAGGMPPNEQNI